MGPFRGNPPKCRKPCPSRRVWRTGVLAHGPPQWQKQFPDGQPTSAPTATELCNGFQPRIARGHTKIGAGGPCLRGQKNTLPFSDPPGNRPLHAGLSLAVVYLPSLQILGGYVFAPWPLAGRPKGQGAKTHRFALNNEKTNGELASQEMFLPEDDSKQAFTGQLTLRP